MSLQLHSYNNCELLSNIEYVLFSYKSHNFSQHYSQSAVILRNISSDSSSLCPTLRRSLKSCHSHHQNQIRHWCRPNCRHCAAWRMHISNAFYASKGHYLLCIINCFNLKITILCVNLQNKPFGFWWKFREIMLWKISKISWNFWNFSKWNFQLASTHWPVSVYIVDWFIDWLIDWLTCGIELFWPSCRPKLFYDMVLHVLWWLLSCFGFYE